MRIKELHLTNIGPFNDAHLEFAADDKPRVTIITGENGTGKTIVLDAIRGLFGYHYVQLERKIHRNNQAFKASMLISHSDAKKDGLFTQEKQEVIEALELGYNNDFQSNSFKTGGYEGIAHLPSGMASNQSEPQNWIVEYWRSNAVFEPFTIGTYKAPNLKTYLQGSLQGIHKNTETTELICYFDVLRDSRDPKEKVIGEIVFRALEKIVKASLVDGGKLKFVRRAELMPIIEQNGMEVPLSNLSSGNLYMIQRLVSLLGKMYAVHILRQTPPETLCDTPGLLLIDEAENHLHPKWQKRFIPTILEIFPNLQIIATTHSPFIVSSVEGAKVYVCKPHTDHCTIEDETDFYANKPVEEVLASPVFGTSPFGEEISKLLEERKKAINENNEQERTRIEERLKEENPQYFAYFDIDKRLEALLEGAEQ